MQASLGRSELTNALRAMGAALVGLGSISSTTSHQVRSMAQLLLDQKKQWCLQQLKESKPLDRRLNELLRLERKQSREIGDISDQIPELQRKIEALRSDRI